MVQPAERADARANRRRLIAAAHELFRERGLDAEMKEIADRAGLGVGTIYRNFPTKDDLVAAIIGEAIAEIQRSVDEAAAMNDPVQAIGHFLRCGFDINERYGGVLLSVLGGGMPAECAEQFARLKEENRIGAIVQAGIDGGAFRAGIDARIVAAQIVGAFTPWTYQDLRRTHTQVEITDAYLDLILRGIVGAVASPCPSDHAAPHAAGRE
jgi:AcrR family transcriptional regulator